MSQKEQWLSRIVFYAGAIGMMWVMGRISPTSAEIAAKYDHQIGAGQAVVILQQR